MRSARRLAAPSVKTQSSPSPAATYLAFFECYSLRCVEPSWQGYAASRFRLVTIRAEPMRQPAIALRCRMPQAVSSRLRRLAIWSRTLRAVLVRQRANALPSRMIPTELARQRADALRAPGLPVIRPAICGWTARLWLQGGVTGGLTSYPLEHGLAIRLRPTLRFPPYANAPPPPCNRAGTSPLRALVAKAPVALRYRPQKIGIRHPASSVLQRASMPWFGLRRPYGIHAFGHARDDSGTAC